MRYIQLTIKGKKLTFPFGLGFLGEFIEELDLSMQELGEKIEKNPFKWLPLLMHGSYKYQCELDGNDAEITYNEFIKSLDNDKGSLLISKFFTAFTKSLTKDVPKQEAANNKSRSKKK